MNFTSAPAPTDPSSTERKPALQLRDKPRVLLAEDDANMRELLANALLADGYEVVILGSGLELYDEVRRCRVLHNAPALVLSDIRMAGPSGLTVLRAIRAWGWDLPVVLITGFGDDETEREAVAWGATLFSKPFDLDDLRTAVMFLLDPAAANPSDFDEETDPNIFVDSYLPIQPRNREPLG